MDETMHAYGDENGRYGLELRYQFFVNGTSELIFTGDSETRLLNNRETKKGEKRKAATTNQYGASVQNIGANDVGSQTHDGSRNRLLRIHSLVLDQETV